MEKCLQKLKKKKNKNLGTSCHHLGDRNEPSFATTADVVHTLCRLLLCVWVQLWQDWAANLDKNAVKRTERELGRAGFAGSLLTQDLHLGSGSPSVLIWAMMQVDWYLALYLYLAYLGLDPYPNIWPTGLTSGPVSSLRTSLGITGLLTGSECHPQPALSFSHGAVRLSCRTDNVCCSLGLWYHAFFISDAHLKASDLSITYIHIIQEMPQIIVPASFDFHTLCMFYNIH